METTKSVIDMFDESEPTDSTEVSEQLWPAMGKLRDQILERLAPTEDESIGLESYGGPTGPRGSLRAWSGNGVDWMINSWLGDPESGFTNMHLTVWLGPETDVPHLGMAWGTLPALWCYIDLLPRADMMVDPGYLDRYYEPLNESFLSLKDDPEISPFVSRDTFTRAGVSQSAICVVMPTEQARIEQIVSLSQERVDLWLGFLDDAPPVPAADRPALAARDLDMRRNIALRDPANAIAERFYGPEVTSRLIGALWGEHREGSAS